VDDRTTAAASLFAAQSLYQRALAVVRTRHIEGAYPGFVRSEQRHLEALAIAPTRAQQVQARFGLVLTALALRGGRREVTDKWFAVGALARPEDRPAFYSRLTEASAAHRMGGDPVAAGLAAQLAHSVRPRELAAGDRRVPAAARDESRLMAGARA
jgi:hypothetical protein